MNTIKATEFKAKCLALMDEVQRTRKRIVVTKNGKPVVELRAYEGRRPESPFGWHKDSVRITGDILSPIDLEWDAQK